MSVNDILQLVTPIMRHSYIYFPRGMDGSADGRAWTLSDIGQVTRGGQRDWVRSRRKGVRRRTVGTIGGESTGN